VKALAIGGPQRSQKDVNLGRESSCVAPGETLTAVHVEETQSCQGEKSLSCCGAGYHSRLEIGRGRPGQRGVLSPGRSGCDAKAGRESNDQ